MSIKLFSRKCSVMRALNDKTVFRCSLTPSVTFKVSENTHNKMKSAVGKILTENTMLTGVGVCPNLGPGPCAYVPTGSWSNTSSKITINLCNTLTEHSCIYCSIGGKITAVTGDLKVYITRSGSMDAMNNPLPKIGDALGGSMESMTKPSSPLENTVPAENEEIIKLSTDVPMSDKAVIDEEKKVSPENVNEDEAAEEVIPEYPYALCDYKNCSEWKNCEYLKADYSAGSVNNNSDELERNYKRAYSEKYDEYCRISKEMNRESSEGNWGKAAHHIISGNQIFALHPYLVKLANYYGYNINNENNCILLPSTNKFESNEVIMKRANAFVAMNYMKQQWHVGGHSYTMDSNTIEKMMEYLEKTSSDNIFLYRNYIEAVEHEINILESRYSKLSCRKNNYEEKKKKFIDNMNRISDKVGTKLLSFRDNPKNSLPYYVSNEAVRYAFDVPHNFIIIYRDIIHGKEQRIAVKMKVKRYAKNDYRVLFSNNSEFIFGGAREFIEFSGNVRYFICLDDAFVFPWKIDPRREYIMADINITGSIDDYCRLSENRIIAFTEGRKNTEPPYEPPTKIIRQRIKEMSENQL